jgi:hypothetical protein
MTFILLRKFDVSPAVATIQLALSASEGRIRYALEV